nr:hypothetical protein [Tanacetum cinerariifolium]
MGRSGRGLVNCSCMCVYTGRDGVRDSVPGNANHNLNGNGNLIAVRAEGNATRHNGNQIRCYNCKGVGHFARNCTVRPRRRDASYLQTQLLIAQKEEEGIQLQAKEFDLMAAIANLDEIEEVNANCILMENLQQTSTSGTQTDKAHIYDSDGSAKVHNNEVFYDNEIFNMFTQEEQYTGLLKHIPESHQVPQNDNNVISEVTSMEQSEGTVEQHSANVEETQSKVVKNDKVIAPEMFRINPFKTYREEKHVPNKVRASIKTKPITVSQPPVFTKKDVNSNSNGLSSIGIDNTKTRRPQPRSNTKNDRVLSASKSSYNKNKGVEVEEHHRNLLLSICHLHKQKPNVSINEKQKKQQPNVKKTKKVRFIDRLATPKPSKPRFFLRWSPSGRLFDLKGKIIASSESESQSDCSNDDNACTSNPLEPKIKRFPNSTSLLGRVYFVEGLGHNLFSVGQFCDSDLEVAFRRNACFVRNLKSVDLLSGNRTTNLYTINLHEMASASSICLTARTSSTKSWLWHQRLSHLNFDTINDLAKNDLVSGLDLTYAPSTITSQQPTEGELDLLFEAMHDDYIGGQMSATPRTVLAAQAQQVRQTSTTSKSIADTAPMPTSSSSQATNIPNSSQDVDRLKTQQQQTQQQGNQASLQSETVADNVPNAMFDANTFVNPFATSSTSAVESSSASYTDGDMCMYVLTVSTMEPKNVKEAMTDPAWIEPMQEELLQFKRMDVWVLVPAPDNISPLTLKWIFKNKNDEENTIIHNKSRFIDADHPSHVYKSKKTLYGLKQAPRVWYDELSMFLLQNHFFKGTIDPTLFIRCFDNDILVVQVYVDDIIFGSTHPRYTQLFYDLMKIRFEMSMMGEMTFFLGLQINQSPCGIFINQSNYVLEILKKYGMESCDPVGTPMEIKDKLDLDQNGTPFDATKYRSMIGALMYLMSSRPDIDSSFEITEFLDADYAGCKDTFKSTSGGAQFLVEKLPYPATRSNTQEQNIDVRYHFIKEHVEKVTIELYFVKMDYQLADIFTKALPADRFNYLVRRLVMNGNPSKANIKQLCGRYNIPTVKWSSGNRRISRCRYNLIPAESRFKTPCSIIKDKCMMKAQYAINGMVQVCLHRHVLPISLAWLSSTLKDQMCENQREVGNTVRVRLWSSLREKSQVVVVPMKGEPVFGRFYGERAKFQSHPYRERATFPSE